MKTADDEKSIFIHANSDPKPSSWRTWQSKYFWINNKDKKIFLYTSFGWCSIPFDCIPHSMEIE